MIRINRRSKTINKKRKKKKRHEIYEWLESFCTGGQGWEFSGNSEYENYEIFVARSRK